MQNSSQEKAVAFGEACSQSKGLRALLAALCLAPLLFCLYTTYVSPRPYYLLENDMDSSYYYGAHLARLGLPLNMWHPGTPIYVLSGALLKVFGGDITSVQQFLNIEYLMAGALSSLACFAFAAACLRGVAPAVGLISMMLGISFPSLWAELNYFSSDSFILIFGLPTLAIFWRELCNGSRSSFRLLAGAGFGMGLCLATKITFLPLAVAMLAACVAHALLALVFRQGAWIHVAAAPAACAGSFLLFCLPSIERLPTFLRHLANRPDTGFAGARQAGENLARWAGAQPLGVLAVLAAAGFALWLILRGFRLLRSHRAVELLEPLRQGFDWVSASVFLALAQAGMLYAIACAGKSSAEVGVDIRNASPSALSFAFLPLFFFELHRRGFAILSAGAFKRLAAPVTIVAAAAFLAGIGIHTCQRREFIDRTTANAAATTAELLARTEGPIAFWDGSPGCLLGEISFHLWGNYRYSREKLDAELLQEFPRFRWLRLRELHKGMRTTTAPGSSVQPPASRSRLPLWNRVFPPQELDPPIGPLISNEATAERPTMIAIPVRQFEGEVGYYGISVEEFVSYAAGRLGVSARPRVETATIAGREWLLIHLSERPERAAAPLSL